MQAERSGFVLVSGGSVLLSLVDPPLLSLVDPPPATVVEKSDYPFLFFQFAVFREWCLK